MRSKDHEAKEQDFSRQADDDLELLWKQFNELFPTDDACLRELLRMVWGTETMACGHCNSTRVDQEEGGRTIKCGMCKKVTWLTAGTFFQHIKHPRAWLAAIWFKDQGKSLSASKFTKVVVKVAQSTASIIFRKLRMVIFSEM